MQNLKHGEYAVNRHIATLITFILLITSILTIFASCGKTEETSTIRSNDLAFEDNSLNANMLFSPIKLNSADSLALASYTVKATIQPATASNQQVDWKVEWASDATLKNQKISDYLSVTPDSDGSLSARVDCYKSFIGNTAVLSATTRNGKIKGTCNIVFIGKATDIAVESKTVKKSTTERGEYYEVYPNKTHTFDINLSNIFNSVATPKFTVTRGGNGSVYFGTEYAAPDITSYKDITKKDINEFADRFITSASVSGSTLTIKTGDKKLEEFYSSSQPDGALWGTTYYDRYIEVDEFDLLMDDEYDKKAEQNVQWLKSCYFYVTVKDEVSGLSETIKLFFVDAPKPLISYTTDLTPTTTAERGTFYQLQPKKTYTFNLSVENAENPTFSAVRTGTGNVYFGTEYAAADVTTFSDITKKNLNSLVNQFITSATISNGVLTITTGDKDLNSYYSSSKMDDAMWGTSYYDRYVFEDEFDMVGGTDFAEKSKENIELVKSCYFSVSIVVKSDGVSSSKEIRFFI